MQERSLTILYDGWSLVHAPESPAALHLLAILARLPPGVEPVVALPAPPPEWLEGYPTIVERASDTAQGRLKWEQRRLPRLAQEKNASLIHFLTLTSPLLGRQVAVISPSVSQDSRRNAERGITSRLLASVRAGGFTRTLALFWPEGLPPPETIEKGLAGRLVRLPQVVHPGFSANLIFVGSGGNGSQAKGTSLQALDLPETFILYHGPGEAGLLNRLLKSWSWAGGAIGEYYPLLALGLDEPARQQLAGLAARYSLEDSMRALPEVDPVLVPSLYQRCSALFHPAPVPAWGGAVQHAIACGKPVVGAEGDIMNALVGPAAYLAPAEDTRALGAALLTVIVEEEVSARLAEAAIERANSWGSEKFGERLLAAYKEILGGE